VQSTPGQGACFTVELPRLAATGAAAANRPSAPGAADPL